MNKTTKKTLRTPLTVKASNAVKRLTARVEHSWQGVALKLLILLIFLLLGWTLDQLLSERSIGALKGAFQREKADGPAVKTNDPAAGEPHDLTETCELCVARGEHDRALKLVRSQVTLLNSQEKLQLLNHLLARNTLKSIRQSLEDLKISVVEGTFHRPAEPRFDFVKSPAE